MRSGRRRARRAGATYTFVTIVFSTLLLGSATIHLTTTVDAYELAVLQARRSAAREAAFGGLRWACADAAARPGEAEGGGRLLLAGGLAVDVRWRRAAPGAEDVVATADAAGPLPLRVTGTLVRRGDALALDHATVEPGPR